MGKTLQKTMATLMFALFTPAMASAQDTESLPFYQNFIFTDTDGKWKVVDNSATPGSTFNHIYMYDSSASQNWGYGIKDDNSGSNDYLVSPAFKLEAGKTYTVDFTHQAYSYGGTLKVELGKDRDDMSTFSPLFTAARQEASNNGNKQEELFDFSVEADGVYYLALHATSDGADEYYYTYLNVNDFMLKEKDGGEQGGDVVDDITQDVPAELPYTADFTQDETYSAWRTLDASDQTGSTWAQNSYGYMEFDESGNQVGDPHPGASLTTDWDSNVNDFFISPVFEFKEGKTYVVKVHAAGISSNEANLSLELATDRRDANSYIYQSSVTVPVAYDSEEKNRTYEVEINKDGRYYLALHARTWNAAATASLNLFSFSVEEKAETEDVAVELPYTADFTKASDTEKGEWETWTKLDRSDYASSTWNWSSDSFITFDENWNAGPTSLGSFNISYDNSNFNDYLVSPAVNLEAGKTYVVSVQGFTRDYSDVKALSLELGTEKKVAGSYSKVGDINLNVALLETEYQALKDVVSTNEVTVDESGKYFFAIHGVAEENKNVYAYLLSFDVKEKAQNPETGINGVSTVVPDSEAAVYTLDGRRAGKLSTLAKGTYIVKVKDASGNVKSIKVMK